MTLRSGSSVKRGDLLVVADNSPSYGRGSGYSTARLAVATSVSRDGSELRAYSDACGGTAVKWAHAGRSAVWAVVDGGPAAACDAFQYRHTYSGGFYSSTIVVFGPEGDEGMVTAARYLRDAVTHWQATGELPVGHNPAHPESVHLGRTGALA